MHGRKAIGYEFHKDFYADILNGRILCCGKPLHDSLTNKEFAVLLFFLGHPNETISPGSVEPLNDAILANPPIRDYVYKITRKLGLKLFRNVRGVGYRLEANYVRPRYDTDRQEAGSLYATSLIQFNEHTMITLQATVDNCRTALARNPHGLPKARVNLARALINLCHVGYCALLPTEGMQEARQQAEQALIDDPKSAPAYGVLGLISLIYDFRWNDAERLLKQALALDPTEPRALLFYAHLLISRGDATQGLSLMEQAVNLDPTDKIIQASWGWVTMFAGDLDRANQRSKEARLRFPEFPKAHFMRGLVLEELKDYDGALEAMTRALELEPGIPHMMAGLGHLYGKMGEPRLAHSVLRDLSKLHKEGRAAYVSGYCQALIYAGLGQNDLCLAALEKSYRQRCDWLIHMAVEPRWAPIRNENRFKRLMAKIGLQQAMSFRSVSVGAR
jgi:tetratricopeptide (TPR) repeat protein